MDECKWISWNTGVIPHLIYNFANARHPKNPTPRRSSSLNFFHRPWPTCWPGALLVKCNIQALQAEAELRRSLGLADWRWCERHPILILFSSIYWIWAHLLQGLSMRPMPITRMGIFYELEHFQRTSKGIVYFIARGVSPFLVETRRGLPNQK